MPLEAATSNTAWLQRRLREIPMAPCVVAWFGWVYAGMVAFAAFRMARVWWAALRLVREASPYAMDEAEEAMLRELAASFCVQTPRILSSARVRSPVVVGVWRTVLLLPRGFERCSRDERRAALCHELAHLERRDCLVHAGVQILMLPLIWHPALHLVGRRIARTREMVCDEKAAAAMRSGAGELTYARCLLNLARTMVRDESEAWVGMGLGLFRTNKLEERVMRLTEVKRVLTMREMLVRRVGGVAVASLALVAGAMVHVSPVIAQESAAAPVAPSASPAPLIPVAPQAEAGVAVPVAPPTPEAPHPMPARAPQAGAAPAARPVHAPAEEQAAGAGLSGTAVDSDSFVDDHFAVARGPNAHVPVPDGRHLHRWVGADGEPYESADENPGELTAEQKRALEAEFARRMAMVDAQVAFWKSPAYRDQLRQQARQEASLAAAQAELAAAGLTINSPEFKKQMGDAAAELAAAKAQFNSPAFKKQMAELNSPQFKAQMDALQAQLAQLDSKAFRDATGQLISAEVEKNLAGAEEQVARLAAPAVEQKLNDAAKRLDEASARLEAATKALAEAQKRLEATPAK